MESKKIKAIITIQVRYSENSRNGKAETNLKNTKIPGKNTENVREGLDFKSVSMIPFLSKYMLINKTIHQND